MERYIRTSKRIERVDQIRDERKGNEVIRQLILS